MQQPVPPMNQPIPPATPVTPPRSVTAMVDVISKFVSLSSIPKASRADVAAAVRAAARLGLSLDEVATLIEGSGT